MPPPPLSSFPHLLFIVNGDIRSGQHALLLAVAAASLPGGCPRWGTGFSGLDTAAPLVVPFQYFAEKKLMNLRIWSQILRISVPMYTKVRAKVRCPPPLSVTAKFSVWAVYRVCEGGKGWNCGLRTVCQLVGRCWVFLETPAASQQPTASPADNIVVATTHQAHSLHKCRIYWSSWASNSAKSPRWLRGAEEGRERDHRTNWSA